LRTADLESYAVDMCFGASERYDWLADKAKIWCGEVDHIGSQEGNFVIVGVLLDVDPSLNELADLPAGCEAERRDPESSWIRTRADARDA
jgi:hypothetical protein